MKISLSALLVTMCGLNPATATMAESWQMVPAESRLAFEATYEGQTAPGEFRKFETVLEFDPRAPASGRLAVTVDLRSADMYSPDINDAVMQEEWLNAEDVRPAEFTSTDITKLGRNRFLATGILQVKGVKKQLQLPFTWEDGGPGAIMDGSVVLDRTDFNVGTGEWSSPTPIGVDVKVNFHVLFRAH